MRYSTASRAKAITRARRPPSCASAGATCAAPSATHDTRTVRGATLVERLHRAGKYVCIETNGTHPLPDGIDWITCSPKDGAPVVLPQADEVKVVYQGQDIAPYERIAARHYFLQPCSGRNIRETAECVLRHPRWRLSLQTHLIIGIN